MNFVKHLEVQGVTLTNNEIKDIVKKVKSLENRGISLKGTSRKIISQEGFLNFLGLIMKFGLSLIKNVLTPLAKNISLPLELMAAASAVDAPIQSG